MLSSDVCQSLVWAGLGDFNRPTAPVKEFEAYGDGILNMVRVLASGVMVMLDADGQELWQGEPEDDDQILALLDKFGHYAAC